MYNIVHLQLSHRGVLSARSLWEFRPQPRTPDSSLLVAQSRCVHAAGMRLGTSIGPRTWSSRAQACWSWCTTLRMAANLSATLFINMTEQVSYPAKCSILLQCDHTTTARLCLCSPEAQSLITEGGNPSNTCRWCHSYTMLPVGVAMAMYNTEASIRGFAKASFEYALDREWPLYMR